MKKLLAIALSLSMVLAFSLAGCGSEPAEPDATAPEHFILTGEYTDGLINNNQISDDAEILIWNAVLKNLKPAELSEDTVVGNFTKVSGQG